MHGTAVTQPGLSAHEGTSVDPLRERRAHSRRAMPRCQAEGETILAPRHPAR